MIPTVILFGVVAVLAVGFRVKTLAMGAAAISLAWGLLVASEGAFVGGTLLAVPNYAVGVLMGVTVRHFVLSVAAAAGLIRRL